MNEEVYQFLYRRDKPMPMKIMGVLAAVFGIGGLAVTPVFGVIMVLAAGGLLAYQSGIELNFRERKYRMITAIGPQGFGSWEPLPEIKCVSVFRTTLVSTTYGRSNASVTTKQPVIQVNLATEQNKLIRLFETEDMNEAIVFAKEVADKLDLRIWDATEKIGKWHDK
jgi:hypothetical protein